MPKRKPIDYTPQFGGGIFRPKDEVESERLVAETSSVAQKRPFVRSFERTDERIQRRHSFDVWQDQLIALTEIQTQLFHKTGRKPKLGELVQEALDAYIAKQKVQTTERSNERLNVHAKECGEGTQ
jgi:CRISPR/Cas system CSM-associated protein Csm2 small subunit